jgi:hypothetical protein
MIDALVIARPPQGPGTSAEAAARTLATLVEGVVEGLLGRVALVGPDADPELRRLAEAAGCALAADPAALSGRAAGWLLALPAGTLLLSGWPARLEDSLRRGLAPGEALAFRPEDAGWTEPLRNLMRPGRMPAGGLLPGGGLAALRLNADPLRWTGRVRRGGERAARWRG